jgi:hypothetical protein
MGVAMMGTGFAEGEGRAMVAAQKAISSPLLEDSSVTGARGVIINVTGGPDLSLMEVNEASSVIQEVAHEDANIIFGAVVDPNLVGKVKITVIATGFADQVGGRRAVPASALQTPFDLHSYSVHANADGVAPLSGDTHSLAGDSSSGRAGRQAADSLTPPPLRANSRGELGLPRSDAAVGGPASGGLTDTPTTDARSPLDVPAFLRRQS